ncbi:hypothetical protein [Piscibacillus salipiscarius]|uniref:Uncharacterized protein n=1 Tax=Piscibacillus salipiscarius TaxID=299480 RepID=A0ABW5Q8R3_9BACI
MPKVQIKQEQEAKFTNHLTDFIRRENLSQQEFDELVIRAKEHVKNLFYTDGVIK